MRCTAVGRTHACKPLIIEVVCEPIARWMSDLFEYVRTKRARLPRHNAPAQRAFAVEWMRKQRFTLGSVTTPDHQCASTARGSYAFRTWPARFDTSKAAAMGFPDACSIDAMVRSHIEDELN